MRAKVGLLSKMSPQQHNKSISPRLIILQQGHSSPQTLKVVLTCCEVCGIACNDITLMNCT